MNFFEHQDRARGTTRKLVLLFAAAVGVLILITSLLVVVILGMTGQEQGDVFQMDAVMGSSIFLGVAAAVIGIVLLGTLYRTTQLRGGGRVVAESLGGRMLNLSTRDADERKILNVVEEMALACGLPVPPVYLLEDPAINAFAAGYAQRDAVIGVTRGCIQKLSRDELQGVVAHEFSHIFNGDMRLNIRLIGWLYGIMVIGLIGYFLMRGSVYRHAGRSSRNDKGGGIVFLGLGLMVVGYGGTFFGNLIKSAVSRQREFLADASAVQFTRNPSGIGGALKKIGGFAEGSHITTANTAEFSHMLFGEGEPGRLAGLFATHPPLQERIRRIEPRWNGEFLRTLPARETPHVATAPAAGGGPNLNGLADRIGQPGERELALARERLAILPELLRDEVHSTLGSTLVVQALIVAASPPAVALGQQSWLRENHGPAAGKQFDGLLARIATLPRTQHLALVELALPALAQLSQAQVERFMAQLYHLMQADDEITLFEWCLYRILRSHLDPRRSDGGRANEELDANRDACRVLLSALAHAGHPGDEAGARGALAAGLKALDPEGQEETVPAVIEELDLQALDTAIEHLRLLKPLQKPRLLKALVACIQHDHKVSAEEGELLRAIGAVLDCPIPPLG